VQESHGFCDRCRTWVCLSKRPKTAQPTPAWFRHSYDCRRRFHVTPADMTAVTTATGAHDNARVSVPDAPQL
jgi:hypothetical protein